MSELKSSTAAGPLLPGQSGPFVVPPSQKAALRRWLITRRDARRRARLPAPLRAPFRAVLFFSCLFPIAPLYTPGTRPRIEKPGGACFRLKLSWKRKGRSGGKGHFNYEKQLARRSKNNGGQRIPAEGSRAPARAGRCLPAAAAAAAAICTQGQSLQRWAGGRCRKLHASLCPRCKDFDARLGI